MRKRLISTVIVLAMLFAVVPQNYVFAISGTKGDSIPAIDDFTAGELYADEESIYSDAFDKYADTASIPSNYTTTATDFSSDKEGSGYGNSLSANRGKTDKYNAFYVELPDILYMGQYHITFDIKPGNNTSSGFHFGGGDNHNPAVPIATGLHNLSANTDWYKVDILYDADMAKASYNIYNASGTSVKSETATFTSSGNYTVADESMTFMLFATNASTVPGGTWSDSDCQAIDNLHIGKYKDTVNLSVSTTSSQVNASVTITNKADFDKTYDIYVGAYSSSGELLGFGSKRNQTVSAGATKTSTATIDKPSGTGITYKAFLWRYYNRNGNVLFKPMAESVAQ